MINVLARIDKKKLLPIVKVVAVVAVITIAYGTFTHFRNRHIQQVADKKYSSGCSDDAVKALKDAYSSEARNSDGKGKRAEQIGNCYALTNKLDEAEKWFRSAETDYRNSKNTVRADEMKQIADNYKLENSIPKAKDPDNLTDEQKKQGVGSN